MNSSIAAATSTSLAKPKFQIGSVVEVDLDLSRPSSEPGIEVNLKGTCRLYVVGHSIVGQTPDGTPIFLYTVSDLPVEFPLSTRPLDSERLLFRMLATVLEHVYEELLRPTEPPVRMLHSSVDAWLKTSQ